MEEQLKSALEPNEKVLWRGEPEKYTALDLTHKQYFIKQCIITAVLIIAISALYAGFAAKNGAEVKTGLLLIAAVFCAYKPLTIMTDARKLARDTIYVATDKRLMVVKDNVRDMEYSRIHEAAFKTDADGHVSLLCGNKAIESAPVKWRAISIFGQGALDEEDAICESFGFYAIKDAELLKTVLADYIPGVK